MNYKEMDEKLKKTLKPERYRHCKGVEKTASYLAEIWGADVEKARIAGLLHDLAKNLDQEKSRRLICQITRDKDILGIPALWHAPIGAYLLESEYGVKDPEIYDAVYYHASGKTNMSLLSKIVYVAVLIEPGRDGYLNWSAECRRVAETDLDRAVLIVTDKTIESLIRRKMKINSVVAEIHNEALEKLGLC